MLCGGGALVATAVVVLAGASLVDVVVLGAAWLVVVVMLGAGEDTTVAVLRVVGSIEVSIIMPVGMIEVAAPAMAELAEDFWAARTLDADASDAEAAELIAAT